MGTGDDVRMSRLSDLSEQSKNEWDGIARRAVAPVFSSFPWLLAWDSCVTTTEPVEVVMKTVNGSLVAALPTTVVSRRLSPAGPSVGFRIVAGSTWGAGDHIGPLGDPAHWPELFDELDDGRPWLLDGVSHALINRIPSYLSHHAVMRVRHGYWFPQIESHRSESQFPVEIPSKRRKELRRRTRRLEDAGLSIVQRRATEDDINAVSRLHSQRWRDKQGHEGQFPEQRRHLLQSYVDFGGELWATLIEAAGEPVAGLLGMQYGSYHCEYKSGWQPEYREHAPGKLVKAWSMARAVEAGVRRYDYLRGEEDYKHEMGAERWSEFTVVAGGGTLGTLARLRHSLRAL